MKKPNFKTTESIEAFSKIPVEKMGIRISIVSLIVLTFAASVSVYLIHMPIKDATLRVGRTVSIGVLIWRGRTHRKLPEDKPPPEVGGAEMSGRGLESCPSYARKK